MKNILNSFPSLHLIVKMNKMKVFFDIFLIFIHFVFDIKVGCTQYTYDYKHGGFSVMSLHDKALSLIKGVFSEIAGFVFRLLSGDAIIYAVMKVTLLPSL